MAPNVTPDLSRLRGLATLPPDQYGRISAEELRYLLGAVDERDRLAADLEAIRVRAGQGEALAEVGGAQIPHAPLCARCGLVPVLAQGRREDMPVCAPCERDALLGILLERERELAALRAALPKAGG